MALSRDCRPLTQLTALTLGNSIAATIAGSWLGDSGAAVSRYRPGWQKGSMGSPEQRFESQVGRNCSDADFDGDAEYQLIISDSDSLSLLDSVPERLRHSATVVEVTSPEDPAGSFSRSLISDMKLWARSGLGYLTREMDEAGELIDPCLPLNRQASILAGIAAATAGLAIRLSDEPARHISVDQLELLAIMPMQPIAFAQMDDRIIGAPQTPAFRMPGGTVESANGLAYVRPVEPDHWARLLRLIGGLEKTADEVARNPAVLREQVNQIDTRIRTWALALTSEEIADRCQAEHIPVAPVYRPDQVIHDAHLLERDFVREDGVNLPWLSQLDEKTSVPVEHRPQVGLRGDSGNLPLSGLRILDLSWAWAGPFATTLLSDLGAEVINVEWHPRASNLRRNPPFAGKQAESNNTAGWWSANQRGKFSIGVNLKSEEGTKIIRELAAQSDVVVENFSPGVVDRLGVGFDDLRQVNSRLVYVSLSAFGQTGPRAHYIGYGTQVYAAASAGYATSQDGTTCSQMYIPYPDPVSGLGGAFAIAAFVNHARASGQAARVDLSELETVAAVALEPLLDALDGDQQAAGTHRYLVATSKDSQIVAILLESDNEWAGIANAVKSAQMNHHSLVDAIAAMNADEVLTRCADRGLTAVLVAHSSDVLGDQYLQDRGFWIPDLSEEVGPSGTTSGASLWHLDGQRTRVWRGAPRLFGDTARVLTELLGYEEERIAQLTDDGSIA